MRGRFLRGRFLRKGLGVMVAILVVSLGATACDVRVAGKRCTVKGSTAQDATHLLVCTNGRWVRSATKVQLALILLAVIQSQTPHEVAAGNGHSCTSMENGDLRCWGFNTSGQLGDDTATNRLTPVLVRGVNVNGVYRETSTNRDNPITGAPLDVGAEFGCAVEPSALNADITSHLSCWGFNGFGQIGDGTTTNRGTAVDVPGPGFGGVGFTAVGTGTVHACAWRQFGKLLCWGQNASGQLGNGTTNASATPVEVSGPVNSIGNRVVGGGSHTCALAQSAVSCWGGNGSGQLGDGTTTQRLAPVPVALANVSAIEAGGEETCAVVSDRTARCWGSNVAGQLGDGTTTARSVPTSVSGLAGVASISVGQDHACAVLADGTVRCWGNNANGQLGDGTTSSVPVQVPGIVKATSVSAGFGHTCAVADRTVRCWGRNDFGQLGDGTTTERHTPVMARI